MSEWETFCDEWYYHLWRVRRKSERGFNDGFHLQHGEEARALVELLNSLERERDEAREAFIEARKHREQLNSLLASHAASWDEIRTTLGHQEQGDQRCDLDRVLDAIRERDEARERASKLAGQLLAEMEAQP